MNRFEKISEKQYETDIIKPFYPYYSSRPCVHPDTKERLYCDYNEFELPKRATTKSAAYDLSSRRYMRIEPNEMCLIPTGVKCQLDDNMFLGVYIRSSMASKFSLELVNAVGIIDADYYNNKDNEGHIWLAIRNNGDKPFYVYPGNRLAQGIIQQYHTIADDNVTEKRAGGFGSTDEIIAIDGTFVSTDDSVEGLLKVIERQGDMWVPQ